MRYRSEPVTVGAELADGGTVYRVARVEPPPNPNAFEHAWVLVVRDPCAGQFGGAAAVCASERSTLHVITGG